MPNLSNIYTFRAVYNGQGRDVHPYFEDLEWSDEPRGEIDYERKLSTPMVFRGADFDFFQFMREDGGICAKADFTVRENGTVRFTGFLAVAFSNYSRRDAIVSFEPQTVDEYVCYELNENTTRNILNYPKVPPLRVIVGTLSQSITCNVQYQGVPSGLPPNLCLPDGIGWTLVNRQAIVSQESPGVYITNDFATFQREEFSGTTPPGGGWTEVSPGLWARPLYTRKVFDNFSIDSNDEDFLFDIRQEFDIIGADPEKLPDNGVHIHTVISNLFANCDYEIRSNVLNLNPDGTAPDNLVYQQDKYHNLIIFQKTDIKTPDADQNATIGELSIAELMEFLALLEIYPSIRNGVLRIEHISYFGTNGLNLEDVLLPYQEDDLQFNGEDIPRREVFSWMDALTDPDFDGQTIEYDPNCSSSDEEPISSNLFSTNFADMQERPDRYVNEGFCPVSTFIYQGQYYINIDFLPISGEAALNAPMAWSSIHETLYQHNRHLPEGTINGNPTVFLSYRPKSDQQPFTVNMTADEYFSYDPSKRVRSQIDWGKVKSSTWSERNNQLTLQLSHNE